MLERQGDDTCATRYREWRFAGHGATWHPIALAMGARQVTKSPNQLAVIDGRWRHGRAKTQA